jgi:probable F420-dependent oxidoreductase
LSLALAAEHSSRVTLGTAIVVAFARNPMSLAYAANEVHAFSDGRVVVGLGSQVRAHIERRFSAHWSRPAARMREYVLALRAIWQAWNEGSRLEFRGEFYTHDLTTPLFTPAPNPNGAPRVFLAAVGPGMTEVAGEVADGVITHGFCTPLYLREVALPALERGLSKSGRTRADVEVTCPGFVAVATTESGLARARAAMRRHVAFYASTPAYRPVLELHGWGDLQPQLSERARAGAWGEMAALVDDAVLDEIAIVATPATLVDEVAARYGGLVDRMTVAWWHKDWWPDVENRLRAW